MNLMRFLESNWVKPVAVASSAIELQDSMFENINERNLSPNAGSKRNKDEILKEMLEERKNKVAKTKEYRNQKLMKEKNR
ncbi:hypothetical protein ALC53_11450 [Atta colombica]|uniref:Uncharacterized protein n=1 Tax=Atta colombica TaxID=520822 RepID=A0A151HZG9_9HYME|nr:hypothetical protein ALC53_11450 [Atta colombica]